MAVVHLSMWAPSSAPSWWVTYSASSCQPRRALVSAIEAGQEPDPALPAKGLLRSRHNNYFTLPVLFIMISNHFPSTYGHEYNWLILAGIAAISVLVRHYFNTRHLTQKFAWTLPAGALGMICLGLCGSAETGSTKQPGGQCSGGA